MRRSFLHLTCFALLVLAPSYLTSCFEADEETHYGMRVDDFGFLVGTWDECDASGVLRNDNTENEVYHLTFYADGTAEQTAVSVGKTLWTRHHTFWVEGSATEGGIFMRYDVDEADHSAAFLLRGDILKYGTVYYKKRH